MRSLFRSLVRGFPSSATPASAAAALITVLLLASSALGAEPEGVRFVYQSVARCPDQDAFLALVASNGARLVPSDDATAPRFEVTLSGSGAGPFAGQLRVRSAAGAEAVRLVAGEHCSSVARAVALLATIALQDAPGRADLPTVTPPEPAPPAAADASTPSQTSATASPAADPWPFPVETPPQIRQDVPPPPLSQRRGWHIALSASGGLSSESSAPVLEPSVGAYVEAFRNVPGWVSPSFRIGVVKDADWTDETQSMPPGVSTVFAVHWTTEVRKTVARLDACPLHWVAAQPWSDDMLTAQACARLDVGQLELDPSEGAAVTKPWVSAGTLLRVRWLLSQAFFEADGGAMFPLATGSYLPGPAPFVVSSAPAGVMSLGVGLLAL